MILQALTSLYEALAQKGEISKEGWSREKISFALSIDEEGNLLRVTPLFDTVDGPKGKTREVPQKMTVPIKVGNTSPKFLWGNSGFILGTANDKTPEAAKDCFKRNRDLHHEVLKEIEVPAAKAILSFFDRWEPEKTLENELVTSCAGELLGKANMVFRFNGKFIHEIPQLAAAWQAHYGETAKERGQCLITGALDAIPNTHPLIKGVQGAKSSGAALVSFNESAFCSYKKKQNQNAPVGKYAAFAYTTALNHLLADRKNVHRIGDAAVVCWAENADKQYEDFAADLFFGDGDGDQSDEQWLSALQASVELLAKGLPCRELDLDPERKFYILGISPNAARLAVRFFYCDSFGNIVKNIKAHYDRLEIVRPSYDKYPMLPLWKLLSATVNPSAKDKTPNPAMAGAVARAVFSGGRYPASILECTFLRIRAEREITRERAAIIKAYYLRNPNEKCPKEVLTVSLNETSKNVPYTLGRLFSVYEEIQQAANPGINTTIKDKYFGSAATMPATVFPILSNLAQKHLRKLSDAQRIYLDKKVMTLKSVLGEQYPAHMSLPEQGSFDLGYYHQTQDRYTKKEDK
ncbi:MAG: type I-C CRISPR-associated protein Cas8c/Csd1 [Christensenellaceae bacterium]|jgi:CRISPR-associated protein, csd1 family